MPSSKTFETGMELMLSVPLPDAALAPALLAAPGTAAAIAECRLLVPLSWRSGAGVSAGVDGVDAAAADDEELEEPEELEELEQQERQRQQRNQPSKRKGQRTER